MIIAFIASVLVAASAATGVTPKLPVASKLMIDVTNVNEDFDNSGCLRGTQITGCESSGGNAGGEGAGSGAGE